MLDIVDAAEGDIDIVTEAEAEVDPEEVAETELLSEVDILPVADGDVEIDGVGAIEAPLTTTSV